MSDNSRRSSRSAPGGRADNVPRLRSWMPALAGLVVVLVAAAWLVGARLGSGDGGATPATGAVASGQELPSFVTSAPARVQEAYAYAASAGDETTYIPCYCGCGAHSGHRWIRDCFVKDRSSSGITYDQHAAGCDVCVSIALMLKQGLASGQSLPAIRKSVDEKYGALGPPTDTPMPPA